MNARLFGHPVYSMYKLKSFPVSDAYQRQPLRRRHLPRCLRHLHRRLPARRQLVSDRHGLHERSSGRRHPLKQCRWGQRRRLPHCWRRRPLFPRPHRTHQEQQVSNRHVPLRLREVLARWYRCQCRKWGRRRRRVHQPPLTARSLEAGALGLFASP
jgi:hypothetical protein